MRGLPLPLLALLFLVGSGLGTAATVEASAASECRCGTLENQAENADAVFIGTVRDISVEGDGPAGREVLWNVEVEQLFVGPDAAVIAVSGGGDDSNCHIGLDQDATYGIVAFWSGGHLTTSQCGVTAPDSLEALMAASDEGSGPSPILAIVGIAMLGGGAVALFRLRKNLS